jgi:hypothetical protein
VTQVRGNEVVSGDGEAREVDTIILSLTTSRQEEVGDAGLLEADRGADAREPRADDRDPNVDGALAASRASGRGLEEGHGVRDPPPAGRFSIRRIGFT